MTQPLSRMLTDDARLSPAIMDDLKSALLPKAPHPYGTPRDTWLDHIVQKMQRPTNALRPHVHIVAVLAKRQDNGESLDAVLEFPRLLTAVLMGRVAERCDLTLAELQVEETRADGILDNAQWRYETERSESALVELHHALAAYHTVWTMLLAKVQEARAA